jgi:hypothetical protein
VHPRKNLYAVRAWVATCLARPHARGVLGGSTRRTSFPPSHASTPCPTVGRTPTNTLVDHTSRWSSRSAFARLPLTAGPW